MEMSCLGFVEFNGLLLERLIQIDLFESVHELRDGVVLFLWFVGMR